MQTYEEVISQHEAIKQQVAEAPNTVQLEQIMSLLKVTRQTGATTSSAQEREALRDILRYWSQYLNKNYDVYPDMHLAPFNESQAAKGTLPDSKESGSLPLAESAPPVQVTSGSVNTGFSQLKWVFALMIGMIVLFFVIQVIFPPGEAAENLPATIPPDGTMVVAVTETHVALARSETATAVSAKPTETITPEIIYATATLLPIPQAEMIEHIVAEGDTLFSIAKQYDITIEALQTANNLDSERITIGEVLVIEVVSIPETAVSQDPAAQSSETVRPIANDADAVIHSQSEQGTTALLVAPEASAKQIENTPSGTFVYAVGKTEDGSWLLIELNGRTVRGWVPATEIGLLYPLTPEQIPVIQTP